jgi:hypothetical protein
MQIPTILSKISKICASTFGDFSLGNVCVERDSDGPVAVVTDGRRIVSCRWPEDRSQKRKNFSVLIPRKQWEMAMRMSPPEGSVEVEEPIGNDTIEVKPKGPDKESCKLTITKSSGRFPRWRSVLFPHACMVRIAVNGNLLRELLEALPLNDEMNSRVEICVPANPTDSIIFKADGQNSIEVTAAIMPLVPIEEMEWEGGRDAT